MADSLRDQLLGLGFKPQPQAKPKPKATPKPGSKPGSKPGRADARKSGRDGDIDLAKAYAIRAQKEKDERIEAERRKQEAARLRREARARLVAFLDGKALNDPAAEIARHFEYGGKIKRIYVNEAQLKSLNAGELGVVQLDGRYLLVDVATLDAAAAILPACVALRVDPDAHPEDDIPRDLVW